MLHSTVAKLGTCPEYEHKTTNNWSVSDSHELLSTLDRFKNLATYMYMKKKNSFFFFQDCHVLFNKKSNVLWNKD